MLWPWRCKSRGSRSMEPYLLPTQQNVPTACVRALGGSLVAIQWMDVSVGSQLISQLERIGGWLFSFAIHFGLFAFCTGTKTKPFQNASGIFRTWSVCSGHWAGLQETEVKIPAQSAWEQNMFFPQITLIQCPNHQGTEKASLSQIVCVCKTASL